MKLSIKSDYDIGLAAGAFNAGMRQTQELRLILIAAVCRSDKSNYWRGYKDAYKARITQRKALVTSWSIPK